MFLRTDGRVIPHGGHWKFPLIFHDEDSITHPESRKSMSLISLIVTLIVIGVLLWLINTYIPMDGKIKKILNVVVVICVVVWLLSVFGILGHTGNIRVPQVQ